MVDSVLTFSKADFTSGNKNLQN